MEKSLVSVIIPCYNAEQYVEEAVRSILNQTYNNLEIICVDDGSTDRTANILEKLASLDPRIICIYQKENLKIVETLNNIIPKAKGEFIARMDADDICPSNRIEKQVNFLHSHPEIAVVGSWAIKFGAVDSKWEPPTLHEEIVEELFLGSPLPHSAVMFRRSIIDDIKYDANYLYVEDYKLWFELSKKYKLANIPEYLLYYRIYSHQTCYDNPIQRVNLKKLKIEIINYFLSKYNVSFLIKDFQGYETLKNITKVKNKLPCNIYYMIKTSIYLNSEPILLNLFYFIFSLDILRIRKRYVKAIFTKYLLKR